MIVYYLYIFGYHIHGDGWRLVSAVTAVWTKTITHTGILCRYIFICERVGDLWSSGLTCEYCLPQILTCVTFQLFLTDFDLFKADAA